MSNPFPIYTDFRRVIDPRIAWTRASSGIHFQGNGVWRTAPVNTPRIHFGQDGQALGVLCEAAGTNLVTNMDGTGAVIGTIGSGGSLPTGYGQGLNVFTAITAQGITNGIPWNEYECIAPAAGTSRLLFVSPTITTGMTYLAQVWAAFDGARPVQVTSTNLRLSSVNAPTSVPITLPQNGVPAPITASWVSSATGSSVFQFEVVVSAPVTYRVRIGRADLKESTVFTTPISGTRATESGESLFSEWGLSAAHAGTFLVGFRTPSSTLLPDTLVAELASSPGTARVQLQTISAARVGVVFGDGSSSFTLAQGPEGVAIPETDYVAAIAWEGTTGAISLNGAAVTEATIPTPLVDRLRLNAGNATVSRVGFTPFRLPDADLRALSRQGAIV